MSNEENESPESTSTPSEPTVTGAPGRWSRVLEITGRTLLTTGLLMLAFVVYQLWGTGIHESRAQDELGKDFAAQMSSTTTGDTIPVVTTTTEPKRPTKGKVVGRIQAPTMGLDKYVVAGVSYEMLKMGPGLFPKSPLPGEMGNVAITGHRTTYGAPFGTIHYLKPGDPITITTTRGVFHYVVNAEPRIVLPSKTSVIKTTNRNKGTLTLVSCHPRWSSERRIIVTADLVAEPAPTTTLPFTTPTFVDPVESADGASVTDEELLPGESLGDGWFHDTSTIPEVLFYGLLLVAIAVLATTLVKRGRRRIVVYPPALVVFIVLLYPFFENLSGLLPANL